MTLTLKTMKHFFSVWHSGLWCCIIIPDLATKCSVVQKVSSGQTFTNILNLWCDLDLKCSNPIFPMTLWLMILYYQTKSVIVIFWLYKPPLWPWHSTQWMNFSAWHSGWWCCIAIPGLATKCSMVQKISSGQTFTNILNLCSDLDTKENEPIFLHDTLPYDKTLPHQVRLNYMGRGGGIINKICYLGSNRCFTLFKYSLPLLLLFSYCYAWCVFPFHRPLGLLLSRWTWNLSCLKTISACCPHEGDAGTNTSTPLLTKNWKSPLRSHISFSVYLL